MFGFLIIKAIIWKTLKLLHDIMLHCSKGSFSDLPITVPTTAPSKFVVTASSSTSVTASWNLPPAGSRHGLITGFKLFYKERGSSGSATLMSINSGATFSKIVIGLDKYTEYEFKCWPLLLLAMDQKVLLRLREQWKMVREGKQR